MWWQDLPSKLSPNVFSIGGFSVRWYSVMYIVAFAIAYGLTRYRMKHEKERFNFSLDFINDLFLWCILGLILGARLGYVLFYNFSYYISNPLEIILPFDPVTGAFTGISGMSFHGGVIGAVIAGVFVLKKYKQGFWKTSELIVPGIPLGYFLGRIGNFLNGELYGRETDSVFGMYFPSDPSGALRHPSQLYEAFLEGIVLFLVLWLLRKKRIFDGFSLGLFLIGYALARFAVEFVRQPDSQLGFVVGSFTMGQLLSAGMGILGFLVLLVRLLHFRKHGLLVR